MATGKLRVQPLISHRFPIEKAATAYDLITGKKKEPFLGILLTYDQKRQSQGRLIDFQVARPTPSAVRLGVVGAGNFANATLLPAIKRAGGIQLVGIASTAGLHAQHAGKKFGFAFAASSMDDLLKDARVNTVAILTRHDSHADLVVKALRAGKHVFVEKPLAISADQLLAVGRQLRKTRDAVLTVGFNRRFSPLGQTLAAFLAGRTEAMHAHFRINAGYIPLEHWTQDPALGGRIVGEACHFVDFISFLVGAAPTSVTARALPDGGKYREDNVSMTFAFPDGSIGVVDYLANGDKSFPKERLEVFCAEKVAVLDDFRLLEMLEGGVRKAVRTGQDKGWVNEWKAFGRAIREGSQPPIPYEQLIGVTMATLAAVESLRLQSPVAVEDLAKKAA
jgi:predicted dehydrogenase